MTSRRVSLVSVVLLSCSALLIAPARASAVASVANGAIRSTLGAGYLQSPSGGLVEAEAEVRVPSITCAHPDDVEQLWLGVEAYEGTDGTGAGDLFAQVLAECVEGTIDYSARINTAGGVESTTPVSPGDLIVVSIADQSNFTYAQAILANVPGHTLILQHLGNAPTSPTGFEQSVLIGQQDLTAVVPTFLDAKTATDRVYFINNAKQGWGSRVNSSPLASDGYPLTELDQANNHVEIRTSALNSSNSDFHLSFLTNS